MKMTKKIISSCLCMLLLLSLLVPVFADEAHYDKPFRVPPTTGNIRSDLYNIAKSQVGYKEDVLGRTYFGEWWTEVVSGREFDDAWEGRIDIDCSDADWCAIFLCWVMEQAGCAYGYTYNVLCGTVDYMFELFKEGGAEVYVYSKDMEYQPKLGDLAFYSYDGGKTLSHVSLTDGKNHYIHANYANSVIERNTNLVYKMSDGINYEPSYIVSPNYELNENSSNKLIAAVKGFKSAVISVPGLLMRELEKLFNTDDNDTGSAPVTTIVIPGDADRDGVISAYDARLILRASVGLESLDAEQMKRADLNSDGTCTADEARTVLRKSVGLE